MADESIRYEEIPNGYRIYRGPFLLGNLATKDFRGVHRDTPQGKVMIHEDMGEENWQIHFTSPQMSVADLEAILNSIPRGQVTANQAKQPAPAPKQPGPK